MSRGLILTIQTVLQQRDRLELTDQQHTSARLVPRDTRQAGGSREKLLYTSSASGKPRKSVGYRLALLT